MEEENLDKPEEITTNPNEIKTNKPLIVDDKYDKEYIKYEIKLDSESGLILSTASEDKLEIKIWRNCIVLRNGRITLIETTLEKCIIISGNIEDLTKLLCQINLKMRDSQLLWMTMEDEFSIIIRIISDKSPFLTFVDNYDIEVQYDKNKIFVSTDHIEIPQFKVFNIVYDRALFYSSEGDKEILRKILADENLESPKEISTNISSSSQWEINGTELILKLDERTTIDFLSYEVLKVNGSNLSFMKRSLTKPLNIHGSEVKHIYDKIGQVYSNSSLIYLQAKDSIRCFKGFFDQNLVFKDEMRYQISFPLDKIILSDRTITMPDSNYKGKDKVTLTLHGPNEHIRALYNTMKYEVVSDIVLNLKDHFFAYYMNENEMNFISLVKKGSKTKVPYLTKLISYDHYDDMKIEDCKSSNSLSIEVKDLFLRCLYFLTKGGFNFIYIHNQDEAKIKFFDLKDGKFYAQDGLNCKITYTGHGKKVPFELKDPTYNGKSCKIVKIYCSKDLTKSVSDALNKSREIDFEVPTSNGNELNIDAEN